MAQCYGWIGKDGNNKTVYFLSCVNGTAGWTPNPVYSGNYDFPSDNGTNLGSNNYGATPGSITALNSQAAITAWLGGNTYQGSGCASCLTTVNKYDCINGQCNISTQYNTPGFYPNLASCQAACGNSNACSGNNVCVDPTTYCAPGKVCIEQGEYSSIQGLISQINSEVC